MDPKAIIRIGFYLEGKASEFHNRWRQQNKSNKGVKAFLQDLRKWVIPRNYEHNLWSKFHQIKQRTGTIVRPIEEVLQDLDMAQIRLPTITQEQIFHQLIDAMDTELRSRVRPHINIKQSWERTKDLVCEYDASIHEERLEQHNRRNTYQASQPRPQSQHRPRNNNQQGRNFNNKPWPQQRNQ